MIKKVITSWRKLRRNWRHIKTKFYRKSELSKAFGGFLTLISFFLISGLFSWKTGYFNKFSDIMSFLNKAILASVGVLSVYIALRKLVFDKKHPIHITSKYEPDQLENHNQEVEKVQINLYNYGKNPVFVDYYSYLVIEKSEDYEEDYVVHQELFKVSEIVDSGEKHRDKFQADYLALRPLDAAIRDSEEQPRVKDIYGSGEAFNENIHSTLHELFRISYRHYIQNRSELLPEHDEGFIFGLGVNEEDLKEKSAKEIWKNSEHDNIDFKNFRSEYPF